MAAPELYLPGVVPRTREFTLTAYGDPAPQGSKTALTRHGQDAKFCRGCKRTHLVPVDLRESSKQVKPWRKLVATRARLGIGVDVWEPLDGPLVATMIFTVARPAGHYGSGRNAGRLLPSAPLVPAVTPDLSKLCRAVEDALEQGGIITNDSRIWWYDALGMVYPGGHPAAPGRPGVYVRLRETAAL